METQQENRLKQIRESKVEWFDLFADYVYDNNSNLYNEACEYADRIQMES
jgi:hypothetical protein